MVSSKEQVNARRHNQKKNRRRRDQEEIQLKGKGEVKIPSATLDRRTE